MNRTRVMIAGVGGASLGTEIAKALQLAGGYRIYGCDISPTAYGLYEPRFTGTYRVDGDHYVDSVIGACKDAGAQFLLPGGEQPMVLLGAASHRLSHAGIRLIANADEVVTLCSDKEATFAYLEGRGLAIPRTVSLRGAADLERVGLPCIVKPATNSGGSAAVFFAVTADEAMTYGDFIGRSGDQPIAQEYVDVREGEFTIGVLSLPDKTVVGSIALRRCLDAKLSVAYRGRGGVVSSGYSQGYIDEFPELCRQAEGIAEAVGSRGPLNIQGRVRNGELLTFEINPRFSASTYLRALAGFNEIDLLIRSVRTGLAPERPAIRPGWYLRSLAEQVVAGEDLK